jgi:branched-chain amino acid aminotransferase
MKIYFNGKFMPALKCRVPAVEENYLNGSALVETMHVKSGKVLNLGLHLARFAEGAKVLLMPRSKQGELEFVAKRLIVINRLRQANLRCRYFRNGVLLMHPLPHAARLTAAGAGIRLLTTPVRHFGPESMQGRLKANSMLSNLLSRWESQAWAEDGLRLTALGFVAEGVWTNIMLEKRGVLMTPPLSDGILEGTTRAIALKRWRAKGKPVKERPLTRYDLYTADKVWVCSSMRGLLKVSEVDGRKIEKV